MLGWLIINRDEIDFKSQITPEIGRWTNYKDKLGTSFEKICVEAQSGSNTWKS